MIGSWVPAQTLARAIHIFVKWEPLVRGRIKFQISLVSCPCLGQKQYKCMFFFSPLKLWSELLKTNIHFLLKGQQHWPEPKGIVVRFQLLRVYWKDIDHSYCPHISFILNIDCSQFLITKLSNITSTHQVFCLFVAFGHDHVNLLKGVKRSYFHLIHIYMLISQAQSNTCLFMHIDILFFVPQFR